MNEQQFDILLLDYVEGALPSDVAEEMRLYAEAHPEAHALVESLREDLVWAQSVMDMVEPPASLNASILQAAQKALEDSAPAIPEVEESDAPLGWWAKLFLMPSFRPALGFAVVFLVVGAVFVANRNQGLLNNAPVSFKKRELKGLPSGAPVPTAAKAPAPRTAGKKKPEISSQMKGDLRQSATGGDVTAQNAKPEPEKGKAEESGSIVKQKARAKPAARRTALRYRRKKRRKTRKRRRRRRRLRRPRPRKRSRAPRRRRVRRRYRGRSGASGEKSRDNLRGVGQGFSGGGGRLARPPADVTTKERSDNGKKKQGGGQREPSGGADKDGSSRGGRFAPPPPPAAGGDAPAPVPNSPTPSPAKRPAPQAAQPSPSNDDANTKLLDKPKVKVPKKTYDMPPPAKRYGSLKSSGSRMQRRSRRSPQQMKRSRNSYFYRQNQLQRTLRSLRTATSKKSTLDIRRLSLRAAVMYLRLKRPASAEKYFGQYIGTFSTNDKPNAYRSVARIYSSYGYSRYSWRFMQRSRNSDR
ncbi:MAG: hypothetical protein EP343_34070 [Deltaproteobacteria bacterium]|nr:MAG: hypothetical protein EP343_34070 [Deltaproteobacteria bacterium]